MSSETSGSKLPYPASSVLAGVASAASLMFALGWPWQAIALSAIITVSVAGIALAFAILIGSVPRRHRRVCLPRAEILDWGKGIFCVACGRNFDDQRTLVLHCKATHPETYDIPHGKGE